MQSKAKNTVWRVLILCHGNIFRSPMSEFILKDMVRKAGRDEFFIESAAVSREEIGNPIYPPAKRCLSSHGVPLSQRRGPGRSCDRIMISLT